MHVIFFGLDLNYPFQQTAARVVYELSKLLSKKGHQATIITNGKHSYMENSIRFLGIPLLPYPNASNYKNIYSALKKIDNVDVINGIGGLYSMFFNTYLFRHIETPYIHTLTTGGFASLNISKRKIKSIWEFAFDLGIKSPLVTFSTIFWSPQFMKYFNNGLNIKGIITPSLRLLKYIKNYMEESILHHISFGVDTEQFSPIKFDQIDKFSNIIYFGHANRHRGFSTLTNSFKLARDKFPEIKLNVFTPSSPPFPIRDKKNIKINVGIIRNIDHFLKTAKIIALPFHFAIPELPLTILESMACGNVVITTNILGIPEIIEGDVNGILIDPYDSKELTNKLIQLLSDKDLLKNIGNKARETSLMYDWNKIVIKYLKTYNKILNEF